MRSLGSSVAARAPIPFKMLLSAASGSPAAIFPRYVSGLSSHCTSTVSKLSTMRSVAAFRNVRRRSAFFAVPPSTKSVYGRIPGPSACGVPSLFRSWPHRRNSMTCQPADMFFSPPFWFSAVRIALSMVGNRNAVPPFLLMIPASSSPTT